MPKWNYGDAYLRHPIKDNETAVFENGSRLKVHDIFNPLPDFMRSADVIFVDPPWNIANLKTFYTKASQECFKTFEDFYKRLFVCIADISPLVCYVEMGKQYLAESILEMKKIYPAVTFYNSSYYHKTNNICYIILGTKKNKKMALDYVDEEDAIAHICQAEDYNCVGDLCMGRGLVAMGAAKNSKKFVGTELNSRRLSVAMEKLYKLGLSYATERDVK